MAPTRSPSSAQPALAERSDDRFAALLGARRGAGDQGLAAKCPSERAYAELSERLQNARHPHCLARNITLLRAHPEPAEPWRVKEPPLIEALRAELGRELARWAVEEHAAQGQALLALCGARSLLAHRIIRPSRSAQLHLWSSADQPTLEHCFYYAQRTACGRTLKTSGRSWTHGARGAWLQSALERCQQCARYESGERYIEECEEQPGALVPGWLSQPLAAELSKRALAALIAQRPALDRTSIAAALERAFFEALRYGAGELFEDERDLCVRRGLGARRYLDLCESLRVKRGDQRVCEYHFGVPLDLYERHLDWCFSHREDGLDDAQAQLERDVRAYLGV